MTITPRALCGCVTPPSSKSLLHRALICASLADRPTVIQYHGALCEDVLATIGALEAFGAHVERGTERLTVYPCENKPSLASVDCSESGSTLRFLLPVAAALGIDTEFIMRGRLARRPTDALIEALRRGGCGVERIAENTLSASGQLRSGDYSISGEISSQYVSGMLLALARTGGESRLAVTGKSVSVPYTDMTLDMLRKFGARIEKTEIGYHIYGGQQLTSPGQIYVGSDPSAAAFWHSAAALGGNNVQVISDNDTKGDGCAPRLIREIVSDCRDSVDVSDIPDLAAPLAALAAVANRHLLLTNTARLRLKESDRVLGIVEMVSSLGGRAVAGENSIEIFPNGALRGGRVDPHGDHRIAMAAAVAASACRDKVTITDAECIRKSYPDFAEDYRNLGGKTDFTEA